MDHEWDDTGHCYFKKQPETPEEIERAIRACWVGCCQAVRYGGNDPEILRRFVELGAEHVCDALVGPPIQGVLDGPARPPAEGLDRDHPLWDEEMDGS